MNLGQLRTSLQTKGWETDTATIQTEALNAAYRRVVAYKRWPFMEAEGTVTATVGQGNVSLAALTTLLSIDSIRLASGTQYPEVSYRDPETVKAALHADRDNGTPVWWTYYDDQLWLYPRPDLAYTVTVQYILDPPDLSADGDTPIIPAAYHDLLVWGAISDIAFRERDYTGQAVADQKYARLLREMEGSYHLRQRQTRSQILRSPFWDTVEQGGYSRG